jgi:hypothetical protein
MSGSLTFAGVDPVDAAAYVILFDADDPAPPVGTGEPITFTAVPPDAWSDASGVQAASYALTRLAAGSYQVNGLLDVDGDFNPFASALAGGTCGDWVGTHLQSLASTESAPVAVEDARQTHDVSVVLGLQLPIERPSFTIETTQLSLGGMATGSSLPFFRLRTTGVATAFSPDLPLTLGPACAPAGACDAQLPTCGCDPATVVPCGSALWFQLTDADLDGLPDPYPDADLAAEGILDVWPRVYLEYVGEDAAPGERWVTQAFPALGELSGALAQGFDLPTALAALQLPVGVPVPAYELSVTFVPVFRHYHADGALVDGKGPYDVVQGADLATVPTGGYAVTVVAATGQTWTVPNEIGLLGLPSLDPPSFDPLTQGAVLAISP